MALPGAIIRVKDDRGNFVPMAVATYAQYVVTVIKGVRKGLDIALNELADKNDQQDSAISSVDSKAQSGIDKATAAQKTADSAKSQASANKNDISNLTQRFGTVTKFNSGTATPTYSCADGEVYFQIKS